MAVDNASSMDAPHPFLQIRNKVNDGTAAGIVLIANIPGVAKPIAHWPELIVWKCIFIIAVPGGLKNLLYCGRAV